ncbi:MAG: hypothetical protein JST00_41450 [Deltaproteobacteria bacterium]|nr:hypothetical protein [Deltaproteobacteria bacterium]
MKRVTAVASAAALAGFAFFAMEREASAFELGTPASEHPYRSPQNFAFELRFSPYKPQIDEEPGLANAPYHQTFGSMRRLLVQFELDWQVFRIPHFGTVGPGLSVGYTSMSEVVKTVSGRDSGDETALDVFPFYAVGVVRADALWHDLRIPIVPYAKAGLAMGIWRATNTGETSVANNVSGKGTSWGTQLAGGVALALDSLDQYASRNMDNATGINNTYVYIEAYWLALNGIGQTDALRIGTVSWAAGLTFEF